MIGFTPKPWRLETNEDQHATLWRRKTHSKSGYNLIVKIWSLGGYIAEVSNRNGRVTREKMLSNGRLITISPDMYDLLTKVLTGNKATMKERIEIFNNIKAVLAYVDGTGPKP
jgi:hypothetical protein